MKQRRRQIHPLTRLAIACGSASRNIGNPTFRRIAGEEAERIPKSRPEIGGGRKGELARMARNLLARLPSLAPEEFDEAAIRLRGFADAIASRFEQTSEISLGDRRRRSA